MVQATKYDMIIVGAGVSGPFIAHELCKTGKKVLLLEAGQEFHAKTYPNSEVDGNSQLYWSGGIELNTNADIGILRPKAVGGGSIVNQALLDRFDDIALDSWKEKSGVSFFNRKELDPWYDEAEKELHIQKIPAEYRNENAKIFQKGFDLNNHQWAPLTRAQKDCRYEDGNDCIECLSGCPIDSKQSTPVTVLKKALKDGLTLISEFEVLTISNNKNEVKIHGINKDGDRQTFQANALTLAAGAIGNSKILLNSGFDKSLPHIGKDFYTHPQAMVLGIYDKKINAHKGPLQSLKSDDPNFRANYFKLENVFAPPVAIAMLLPGIGEEHLSNMKKITNMACIEVAIRDTNPGRITTKKNGALKIYKSLNQQDKDSQKKGLETIYNIFKSTGAKKIIEGVMPIGLHLMGGLCMGTDPKKSVVNSEFRLHGHDNIYVADSSIFPNAPGINPSFTIMALSKMAAANMTRSL